jgi:hypothetical protein
MKRQRPEHKLQCEVVAYWAVHGRPDLKLFAVANGELRHPSVALRLKAEGVRPGVADLCVILDGGRTGWMELKAKGGSMSDEQKGFARTVQINGHYWALVRSVDDAAYALAAWGALKPRREAA